MTPRRRGPLRWGLAALALIVAAGLLVDFGYAAAAEYRLSRTIRSAAGFTADPEVTIAGFPFMTAARDGRYRRVNITEPAVPLPKGHSAKLEADLDDVRLPSGTTMVDASTPMRIGSVEARVRLDQKNIGRYLGIVDLTVHTPVPGRVAGAGSPADGLVKSSTGVVLTGTVPLPEPGDADRKVSVSVASDMSTHDGGVAITATRIYTGPEEHATPRLRPGDEPRVLAAFTKVLPAIALPFGLAPTGARGENADIVLFASAHDVTKTPGDFYRVGV
ncbi:LmeA family phospholipid-binding protein [Tsukamurella sp. 8F]|uniref:LmeA family phospholipid-binding protein n=1 Tax=unclassified Tsukamurella TaxID=2633480 RepID=UPI0023B9BEEC|nr:MULTISPECIES: LmeA family phospholipid-binding protein [unclassified Tsukamurella]MDF0528431.1 LmeA family phospholipid-binding protein [Tsukamurella sp. 8J]MDF0586256.1 LmeA family phospholipid-binding protein [Tsukamurella sp. 8F]